LAWESSGPFGLYEMEATTAACALTDVKKEEKRFHDIVSLATLNRRLARFRITKQLLQTELRRIINSIGLTFLKPFRSFELVDCRPDRVPVAFQTASALA
jgi:hypothetical protein